MMKNKKVYVLLTDTGTLFTRMIKLYTKKPFNHASIAFDKNLIGVYSFGRTSRRNPFYGGFVKENISEELFTNAKCAIYCCTVDGNQINKMNDYIQRIESQKECYRYNLLGLFAILLNKQFNRENAFFCSEFVASVLMESDNFNFKKPLSLITPHDLQEEPAFQLVYQGKLADYTKPRSDSIA